MRSGRFLALAMVLGAPAVAAASDAPHNLSAPVVKIQCSDCHIMHNASGAGLSNAAENYNNCLSCHNGAFSTEVFGGDWASMQTTLGVGGSSHRWDSMVTNLGVTAPDPNSADADIAALGKNLDEGKLMCSTCHDQHTGASVNKAESPQHTSAPIVDPANVCTDVTPHQTCIEQKAGMGSNKGTLQLTSLGTSSTNSSPKGYQIKVTDATPAFKISHDRGTSFLGWNGSAWAVGAVAKPFTAGSTHALDPATTGDTLSAPSVKFNGSNWAVGDTWEFYISYPFLRIGNIESAMCKICHKDRLMKYQDVEGGVANGVAGGDLGAVTLGQTVFHHPTGQTLGTKALVPPDRTTSTMLDADGTAQSLGTDPNKTNDLALGTTGNVHCMTCHQPHVADSNSLTIDQRTPIRNIDQ